MVAVVPDHPNVETEFGWAPGRHPWKSAAAVKTGLWIAIGIGVVVAVLVATLLFDGGPPDEPYEQPPVPLSEFAGDPAPAVSDEFHVRAHTSWSRRFGVESGSEVVGILTCRATGYRMRLEIHRREGDGWTLVTRTPDVAGGSGFGIRHDVDDEPEGAVFEIRAIFTPTDDPDGAPIVRTVDDRRPRPPE